MMALRYSLDPAGFDQWDMLYTLLAKSFAYMEGRIDPPSSFTRMNAESLRQKAHEETLLVVHEGERLVACAYFALKEDAVYIGKVAVDDGFRRRGITRQIMDHAEEFARFGHKAWLELQTRVELVENHLTFEALGFVKTGESAHAGYNRPTSITMRRAVNLKAQAGENR